jgi:hypothetical protein
LRYHAAGPAPEAARSDEFNPQGSNMPHISTSTHKKVVLLTGLAMSVALTTRIEWALAIAENMLLPALGAYIVTVVIALIPYAALWQELTKTASYPTLQLFSTALVIFIAVLGYAYSWSLQTPSVGWELFIVFFWQCLVVGGLYIAEKVLRHTPADSEGS